MDSQAIVSFNTEKDANPHILAVPSAVFELAHVVLRVSSELSDDRLHDEGFIVNLRTGRPDLGEALRELFPEGDGPQRHIGIELALYASHLGYAQERDAERFIHDLDRIVRHLDNWSEDPETPVDRDMVELVERRRQALKESDRVKEYQSLLAEIWQAMSGPWREQGLNAVQREVERVQNGLKNAEPLFDLLPPSNWLQTESVREKVEKHRGDIVISPLYFPQHGAHAIAVRSTFFLGYSLSEDAFASREKAKLADLARRMKAFSDPTRLLILDMLNSRNFRMTVSDMAKRLGVSQPTVSGHLKVLREAELVTIHKKGNKSFYRVQYENLQALLRQLETSLQEV